MLKTLLISFYFFIIPTIGSYGFDFNNRVVLETTPNHMTSLREFLLSQEGGDFEGNGGDIYVIEFKRLANELVYFFETNESSLAEKIRKALLGLNIYSVRNIFVNQNRVTAVNFPNQNPPSIIVSRAEWDKIKNLHDKLQLVFHELLFIIGLDDTHYKVSSKYKLDFVCNFEAPLRQFLEDSSGKDCFNISSDSLKTLYEIKLSFMGEKIHWKNLNKIKFPILKKIIVNNIFLTTKEVIEIVKALDWLKHLDLSATNLKKENFSNKELELLEKKIGVISYGKIDYRFQHNVINEYMNQLISRDQVNTFSTVYSMINKEYNFPILEKFWFLKAGKYCSSNILSWFLKEKGINAQAEKYRFYEGMEVLTYGVHHGLDAFEHMLIYFNNSIKCFETLQVFGRIGYKFKHRSQKFSLLELVNLNSILDIPGKEHLYSVLLEMKFLYEAKPQDHLINFNNRSSQ